jgi:acyl-CoA thioesterase FadM
MEQPHTYMVRIGMADVDAYAFLYYSSYIRHNERAACHAVDCGLALREMEFMKFGRPVRWGMRTTIHTFLAFPDSERDSNLLRVFHVWTCADEDGKDEVDANGNAVAFNLSISTYSMPYEPAARSRIMSRLAAPKKGHPFFRQLMACTKEATLALPPLPPTCTPLAAERQRDLFVRVCPDAIGYGERLNPAVAMDLFERQRTAMIGGQSAMRWLESNGVAVVVYRLRQLTFSAEPVSLGGMLSCVSSESESGNLFFDARQQMIYQPPQHAAGPSRQPRIVAECYIRMVFLKDGELTKPPEEINQSIRARRVAGDDTTAQAPPAVPWLDADVWGTRLAAATDSPPLSTSSLSDEYASDSRSESGHSQSAASSAGEPVELQSMEAKLHTIPSGVELKVLPGDLYEDPLYLDPPSPVHEPPGSVWEYLDQRS